MNRHNYFINILKKIKNLKNSLLKINLNKFINNLFKINLTKSTNNLIKKNAPKYNANDKKVEVSLKFTTEPAIAISNLPDDIANDDKSIRKLFNRFGIERIERRDNKIDGDKISNNIILILSSPKYVSLAMESMNNHVINGYKLQVTNYPYYDSGIYIYNY